MTEEMYPTNLVYYRVPWWRVEGDGASRYLDPRDPTGIGASVLLWMQKAFFDYPETKDFMPPPLGKNATYHEPPDWLQTEKWFDVYKTW